MSKIFLHTGNRRGIETIDFDGYPAVVDHDHRKIHFLLNWRWSILAGYLPYWSWLHWRFEWLPTPALLDEWIGKGEIG